MKERSIATALSTALLFGALVVAGAGVAGASGKLTPTERWYTHTAAPVVNELIADDEELAALNKTSTFGQLDHICVGFSHDLSAADLGTMPPAASFAKAYNADLVAALDDFLKCTEAYAAGTTSGMTAPTLAGEKSVGLVFKILGIHWQTNPPAIPTATTTALPAPQTLQSEHSGAG